MIRLKNWKPICFLLTWMMVLPVAAGFFQNHASASDLLPEGVTIREGFKPGVGSAIGVIRQAADRVVVIHINQTVGYIATEGMPLFKNDTVITLTEKSQANLLFNDGSTTLLAPRTQLQINQSVYSPRTNRRATFMNMAAGMARFVVKQLADVRHSDYNVKTHTTVVGARGSDFIIVITPEATEISSLADTVLEVRSLAGPDEPPLILQSYETTVVRKWQITAEARRLEAREVERLVGKFMFQARITPDPDEEVAPMIEQEIDETFTAPPLLDESDLLIPPDVQTQRPVFYHTPDTVPPKLRAQDQSRDPQETGRNITVQQLEETIMKKIDLSDFPDRPDY